MLNLNVSIYAPSDIVDSIEKVVIVLDLIVDLLFLLLIDVSPLQEEFSQLRRRQSDYVIDAVEEDGFLFFE